MSSKLVSRVSTIDAARAVFFIIIGFAIKQSLALFSHTWPPKDFPDAPQWPGWVRWTIAIGYLVTVIRFSHGVILLWGHEKERIENSNPPAPSKISLLALFLVLLAIPLFLMADNIVATESYLFWMAVLMVADYVYILQSGVVRRPLKRMFKVFRETDRGYAAHAAFWWMINDAILFLACVLFLKLGFLKTMLSPYPFSSEVLFATILFLVAALDYWSNWDFYFGGRKDRRKQKFVFVISPLRNSESALYKKNINLAQYYCEQLMLSQPRLGKKITPLASHAFFPYFLNNSIPEDRLLGLECTLAFIPACDAVYVYVPLKARAFFNRKWVQRALKTVRLTDAFSIGSLKRIANRYDTLAITPGMDYALGAARRNGLEIRFLERITELPEDWMLPAWNPLTFQPRSEKRKASENYFRATTPRKKVYVCTCFRGAGFDNKTWEEKVEVMTSNTKLALWHCHELARDPDAAIAPFAPQAFYPYFWNFTAAQGIIEERRVAWFDRSIEILKVCDAVYIYTPDGLPPTDDDSPKGVLMVEETARNLGLEIQYRKELAWPVEEYLKAKQELETSKASLSELKSNLVKSQKELDELSIAVSNLKSTLGESDETTIQAKIRLDKASGKIDGLKWAIETETDKISAITTQLEKLTWSPAVPVF